MPPNPLYAACIRRAAELAGGFDNLAARLDIAAPRLKRWAAGYGSPNDFQFLKLVDLLEELSPTPFAPRLPPSQPADLPKT
jgi:hypothetical protein